MTGWKLPAGQLTDASSVTDHYNAPDLGPHRLPLQRARRGHCQTGDCGGRFQCTGWGQIPATLAEFNLDAWDHLDFYDVSMVDGSNLPMYINTVGGKTPDKINAEGLRAGSWLHHDRASARRRCRCTAGGTRRRLHLAVCALRHRPLLLPRPVRAGLQPRPDLAGRLRHRLQAGRALRLLLVGRRRHQRLHLHRRLRLPDRLRRDAAGDGGPPG